MTKLTIILTVFIAIATATNAQWTQTSCPHSGRVNCIAVGESNVFTGIENDGIYLSSNDGENWSIVNTGLSNTAVRDIAISGSNIYAATAGSGVFLSTNDGGNWSDISSDLTTTDVSSILAVTPYITIGTYGGGVIGTSDNGGTWSVPFTDGLTNLNVKSLCLIETHLFAGTTGGGVFVFNYGTSTSWTAANTGLTNLDIYTLTVVGTDIYAGTQGGGVFKSSNNGTNWTAINTGLTISYITSFAVSEDESTIFVGTNGAGVFKSTNAGSSWTDVNTGLTPNDVYSLGISNNYLYAGTNSDGIWIRPLSELTGINEINGNSNFAVYPNPAKDFVKININENTDLILNIYDITGSLVKTKLLNQNQQQISITDLIDGVYMLEIRSDNFTEKQKLIIQK